MRRAILGFSVCVAGAVGSVAWLACVGESPAIVVIDGDGGKREDPPADGGPDKGASNDGGPGDGGVLPEAGSDAGVEGGILGVCAPGLVRDVVHQFGPGPELYTLVATPDALFATGWANGALGGLYRIPKPGRPGVPEHIASVPRANGIVVVGDNVYFTSSQARFDDAGAYGGVWSCPSAGPCTPKLVLGATEPGWIEFDGARFYVTSNLTPTRFVVDAGSIPDGGIETSTNLGPAVFTVDQGQVYDLETSRPGVTSPRADFIISSMYGQPDGVVHSWSPGSGAWVAGAQQLAQSDTYVFWGAYDGNPSTNLGGVVRRDPKRGKSGSVCNYGGAPRPNATPYGLVARGGTLYWTSSGTSFIPTGRVECCPIDGPCCVPPDQDAAAAQVVTLASDDQTPTGLAVDDTGIYFVETDTGAVVRLHAP